MRPERRCPTRPRVVENWRKPIASPPAANPQVASEGRQKVEVWVASIASLLRARSAFRILSEQDTAYLARHKVEAARNGALAARILVRLALSRAVGRRVAPADWRFERTPNGKPLVTDGFPDVKFSISHTDELAVVAVAARLNIGVDVETIDQDVGIDVIADFSHTTEQADLDGVAPTRRSREFLRLWTQKEAYTKLVGVGHSVEFSEIDCTRASRTFAADPAAAPFHFENFFASIGHTLYHISLAIEHPSSGLVELQIVDVFGPEGINEISVIPACG